VLVKIPSATFLKAKGLRFPKLFLVLKLIKYLPSYEPLNTKFGCSIPHKVKCGASDGVIKKINKIKTLECCFVIFISFHCTLNKLFAIS
jgi:hypothetical protein